MKKNILISITLLLAFLLYSFQQEEPVRKKHFNLDSNGLAIGGYDPVAYIAQKKAVEGKAAYTYTWKSVKYRFSSQANMNTFKESPEKYEPAYGGWCAYAMGKTGEKVEVDPETFKIIGGRTYLFYNFYFNNTLEDWNKDEVKLKTAADNNWKKITSK